MFGINQDKKWATKKIRKCGNNKIQMRTFANDNYCIKSNGGLRLRLNDMKKCGNATEWSVTATYSLRLLRLDDNWP